MENQSKTTNLPGPQRKKKITTAVVLMIVGGVVTGLSYIINLVILFGVYGCASTNLNKSNTSCSGLSKDHFITMLSSVGTYIGIGLLFIGLVWFIASSLSRNKRTATKP